MYYIFLSEAQLNRQNINFSANQLSSTSCKIEILENSQDSQAPRVHAFAHYPVNLK